MNKDFFLLNTDNWVATEQALVDYAMEVKLIKIIAHSLILNLHCVIWKNTVITQTVNHCFFTINNKMDKRLAFVQNKQ